MGKSIEEILRQIESERNQRINEEQSKLDQINLQRDLARKEWNKRMRMYENLSNTSTVPAAGGGGGSIPTSTPTTLTILEYNTTQGPSFEWNGITFTLDTSLPNYSYTAAITTIPGTSTTVPGHTYLIGVTIGNSVTTIGFSAFLYCSALTYVTFTPTSTLTSIAEQAFGYTGLTSIAIPTSVTSIAANAFISSGLTTVTIANGQLGINSPGTGVSFFGPTVTTVLP